MPLHNEAKSCKIAVFEAPYSLVEHCISERGYVAVAHLSTTVTVLLYEHLLELHQISTARVYRGGTE